MSKQEQATQRRFVRRPQHNKRISWGDDYAGDAWFDRQTGEIVYTCVGVDKNHYAGKGGAYA